jgi:SprT protein
MNLSEELVSKVEDKVLETYQKAQEVFGRTFNLCSIEYVDMGVVAGRANYVHNKIKLSPTLLRENVEHFIGNTVVHEIAHLFTNAMYPMATAHGWEWKNVMRRLGCEPSRCHSYDVSNTAKRKVARFTYRCSCSQHIISSILHNKIQRGQNRICNRCKTRIYMV